MVACEGATEVAYLHQLRRELKISRQLATIERAKGSDPEGVVAHAVRLRGALNEKARRSESVRPDHAFAVFDREGPHDRAGLDAARVLAKRQGVAVLVSTPSFELWLLLHFADCMRPLANSDEAMAALTVHCPTYRKGAAPLSSITACVAAAIERAQALDRHRTETAATGPGSDVFRLVQVLQRIAAG